MKESPVRDSPLFGEKGREEGPNDFSIPIDLLYIGPNPVFASINAYRSFSFRSFSRQAMPSIRITSMATMPKSAVKIMLFSELAKDENGPIQPCRFAATRVSVHTLSGTKGGDVAFQYPQHLNRCWRSDCISVV